MGQHLVTDQQNGVTVEMRVGDSVLVKLAENPTSGYRWDVTDLDVSSVAVESASYEGQDPRPGSGGLASWTLRARAAGKTSVSFVHWRRWAGEASAIARFSVVLEIKPA